MKKISLILLLGIGAVGVSFYYAIQHLAAPPSKSSYYAQYLPGDTLAVISLFDLKGLSQSFPQSALGHFFAKPTLGGMMAEQGVDQETIWDYENFYDGAGDLLTNPFLLQLFGDDITFALLKPDPLQLRHNPEKELQKRLIAFGSSSTGKIIERIAWLALKDFSQERINGLQFTRIRLDDDEFLYGYIQNGVIILAYEPQRIIQALEQKEHDNSLEKQPYFISAQKTWQKAASVTYIHSYCNLEKFRELFVSSRNIHLEKIAAFMQGVHSFTSFVSLDKDTTFQFYTTIEYAQKALHESIQEQLRTAHNITLPFLSENTLFYCWFAGLDKKLVTQLAPFLTTTDQTVQEHLGLNLQQITNAVGSQISLVVNGITNAGFFPLPKFGLFAQIREQVAAQELVQKIRQRFDEKNIADERILEGEHPTIYYWSLLPPEAAHPAVALSRLMLYIANGELSLRTLLSREQQQGLVSPMRMLLGSKVGTQIGEDGYALFFVRPALLAAEAKKAEVWLNAALGNSTEKIRAELLQLMSSFTLATWSIKFTENKMISEGYIMSNATPQKK